MFYAIVRFLARLTLIGYFRKYKIDGIENIPSEGPFIFVANHPSAFMDPIVVASSIKTPVYFIAAGEYVGTGLKGWFFKTILHMIPVYRPSTRPEDTHKNKDMFRTCYEHLSKGNSLLIFPEGVSKTERKLKPIKTGAARIAIGAEKQNDFNLNVALIPIGLNYSDPHAWRSDLFVKIGSPIYVSDFDSFTPEEEIERTKQITAHIEAEMLKNMLHTSTVQEEAMLEKLNRIYSSEIKTQFEIAFEESDEEFSMHQDFVAAIAFFKRQKPIIYAQAEDKIDRYLNALDHYSLTDKNIGEFEEQYSLRRFFSFFFGVPFFLIGYITNIIPYKLVGLIRSTIKLDQTFSGSIALALGLVIFLFWYIATTVFVWVTTPLNWWSLFCPAIIYTMGLYALIYLAAIENSLQRKILRKFYRKNKKKCNHLINERKEIITLLTACKEDYLATLPENNL